MRGIRHHRAHLSRNDEVQGGQRDRVYPRHVFFRARARNAVSVDDRPRSGHPRAHLILYMGERVGVHGLAVGGKPSGARAGAHLLFQVSRGTYRSVRDRAVHAFAARLPAHMVRAPQKYCRAPFGRRAPYVRQKTFARQTRHAEYVKGRFTD